MAKLELALARGKKLHDKRETEKKRDWQQGEIPAVENGWITCAQSGEQLCAPCEFRLRIHFRKSLQDTEVKGFPSERKSTPAEPAVLR
jgi:hypothetical protein